MRDKVSFRLRSCGEAMSSLALEAQRIVRDAARPVAPGEGIKAQMRRAWTALGHPEWWRVRAAWYGEAGSWSAVAFDDLRMRYADWTERQQRRARLQGSTLADHLEATARGMVEADADFHRQDVAGLLDAVRALRGVDRAGDH